MPKDAKISDLTLSRTQIHDYLKCGYIWDLTYRRGITTTKVREALDVGSAVHRAISEAILAYVQKPKAKLWNAVRSGAMAWAKGEREARGQYLTDETREQIEAVSLDSVDIAMKALEFIDLPSWEVAMWNGKPLVEVEVMTKLPPWKGYRVIPDFVARPRSTGKKAPFWLIDWKCRGSFEDDDAEEVNLQFSTMQYVLERETNLSIDGSLLWQIKSQSPRKPTQNKDGSMSRALIVTDWATYSAALKEAKLDPRDYEDMKEKLEKIEWFRTIKQHRTSEECTAVWNEVVVPASWAITRNPQVIRRMVHQPFACKGCWARAFCLAELRGDDTEFLLETDFYDTRAPRKTREIGDARRTFTMKEG